MPSIYERADAVRLKASGMLQLAMATGPTCQSIARVASRMGDRIDSEVLESTAGEPQDCKKGCNHCCHRMIYASGPEILAAIAAIDLWPSAPRRELIERLAVHRLECDRHRDEGFLRFRGTCPFLVDGGCSIYESRPFMCRTTVSVDSTLCKIHREDVDSGVVRKENREPRLAAAASEAFGGVLEFPTVIAAVLDDADQRETLITKPDTFQIPVAVRGAEPLPVPRPDVLEGQAWTAQQLDLLRNQRIADVNVLVSGLTEDIFLKTEMPAIYESEMQMKESLHRWKTSVESIGSIRIKDAKRGYFELSGLRPVKAAYQTFDIRPSLESLGKVICEDIASKIAPELCEPLGSRRPGKVRIGFMGKTGATSGSQWSLGWLQHLDRDVFESTLINTDANRASTGLTYTFYDSVDHYYHLSGHPLETARFVRKLDLDYLIFADIGDNAALYQQAIFRLARRQALSWGTPMTSGLPTIDDYLSSDLAEHPDAADHYTEKLVRLPGTGCTLKRPKPDGLDWSRERVGLPEGFLVCYPQVLIKWLPNRDEILGELCRRTNATIVLFDSLTPYERNIFENRMNRVGARIHWQPFCPAPMFHQVMRLCDIGLDGLDWSGGLTVMESLASGLPFVAHDGPFFRERLAGASLRAVGLSGLIAATREEYLDLACGGAIRAARDRDLHIDALYEDLRPIRALENHIKESIHT